MNNFSGVRIEYHILQTFPVTCLNRDDVNSPKTAYVGGVERARVSSQCWKRQVRLALKNQGVHIAIRTKKIRDLIMKYIKGDVSEFKSKFIDAVVDSIATDTLVFISTKEVIALADYIENEKNYESILNNKSAQKVLIKTVGEILKKARGKTAEGLDGLDIALFGRMVANATDLNVQAASSFSHAITTHKASSSIDFFTAVDDMTSDDESGAGHMGSLEYTSGTYYRYVSLDLGILFDSFSNKEDLIKAVEAFTKALYIAVPSARQNTLSGQCPWNFARIFIRKGQGTQLAFDKPVRATGEGYLIPSIKEMNEQLDRLKTLMGTMFNGLGEFTYGEMPDYSIDSLVADITSVISDLA